MLAKLEEKLCSSKYSPWSIIYTVYITIIFVTLKRKERFCFEKFIMRILTKNSSILKQQKTQTKKKPTTKTTKLLLLWRKWSADQSLSKTVLHLVALINWKLEACFLATLNYNGVKKVDVVSSTQNAYTMYKSLGKLTSFFDRYDSGI